MVSARITPFLIVNPIVIIWMVLLLFNVLNRDGFAVMMSGFYSVIIIVSGILLVVDRLIVRRISMAVIYIVEILSIVVAKMLVDMYLYG